jgi:2-C-methyl-D-erythritol 4-phosphate cytidylyltransferase/2-C-methyl-D-erythritol 2,4-cyclodiphosphate synthase
MIRAGSGVGPEARGGAGSGEDAGASEHGEPNEGTAVRADAVIVAAGSSTRMGGRDKLEALVAGRPLLAWTIDAIAAAPEIERIVVVVAPGRADDPEDLPWMSGRVTLVVPGGRRRQESVAAGVDALVRLDPGGDARPVLVHDGARPLVSPELVGRVARATAAQGAVIPVLPVTETVKRVVGDLIEGTLDRAELATAQTPQGFRRGLLRAAYAQLPPAGSEEWTDEGVLLEACRIDVHAIPGEPGNLKVTLPADLARVDAALTGEGRLRVGFGHDSHPFGPGAPLALGGISIAGAPRLHGHSDGDVALHAVADALLGAAGLGDLGRLFPAGPATPAGISSRELLAVVVGRVRASGHAPASVDLTIIGARPRLAGSLDAMRDAIAGLLELDTRAVNVKASTGNLEGMEGAGRGMSARAVAVLEVAP